MSTRLHNPVIERIDVQTHSGDWPSPCISVCVMNPQTGWCDGCLRSIDEIVQWSSAGEGVKRAVWVEVKRRYAALEEQQP